jgi:hypothetical protein
MNVNGALELSVTAAATPEPEHLLLLCAGVLLAGWGIQRRRRKETGSLLNEKALEGA